MGFSWQINKTVTLGFSWRLSLSEVNSHHSVFHLFPRRAFPREDGFPSITYHHEPMVAPESVVLYY